MNLKKAIERHKENLIILTRINGKNIRTKNAAQVIKWLEELQDLRENNGVIKYIDNYKNIGKSEQYDKINEEVIEAYEESLVGNEDLEKQEICDVVQACYSLFMQMNMNMDDIKAEWKKHYQKEEARGRKIKEIL